MNNKPNNPDEVVIIDRQFSWRTAWSVCGWVFLAFIISALCDWIFPKQIKEWPFSWRLAVVAAQFLLIILFVFDATKWIRGMDELQRRITLASMMFGVSATLFFILLWTRLDAAGFFRTIFGPPFMNNTWGILSVADAYILLSGFYGSGYLFFKRRYK